MFAAPVSRPHHSHHLAEPRLFALSSFELVPRTFTIPELRSVFEVVKGQPYDPGNFRRKFNRLMEDGVLEKAPGKRITGARPAQVFFFKRPAGQG